MADESTELLQQLSGLIKRSRPPAEFWQVIKHSLDNCKVIVSQLIISDCWPE